MLPEKCASSDWRFAWSRCRRDTGYAEAESAELVEYPGQAPGTTQKIVLTALGGNHPTPPRGNHCGGGRGQQLCRSRAVWGGRTWPAKSSCSTWPSTSKRRPTAMPRKPTMKPSFIAPMERKAAAALGAVASLVRSVGGADYRSGAYRRKRGRRNSSGSCDQRRRRPDCSSGVARQGAHAPGFDLADRGRSNTHSMWWAT